ncbi:MAG: hypothetical protein IK014_05475 [Lachnospiraceae bacterium]|nr:hypothetical protein [Lachnospiraceae bacterium]
MYKRIKSRIQTVRVVFIVLCVSFITVSCSSDNKRNKGSAIFELPFETYTESGVVHIVNGIAYFTDAETGYDVALCSKPNCLHKPSSSVYASTCDAYLGPDPSFLFMDNEHIYYVAAPDVIDSESVLFDRILYRADMDGRNKKVICKLDGIQRPRCMAYKDGMVALSYQKIMNKEKTKNGAFSDLEKSVTGIILVDLGSGEYREICEYEGYNANIYQVYFYENKVYFYLFYTASDTRNVKIEDFKDVNDYYDFLLSDYRQQVISYEMESGKKEVVWEGTTEFVKRQSGGYLIIEQGDKMSFLMGDHIVATYQVEELSEHTSDFINMFIYDDVLYMTDEKKVWSMDLKTDKIKPVAGGKLDGKGINRIIGMFDNVVYYLVINDGKSIKYMIDRESFLSGAIENAKIIMEEN